MLDIHKLHAGYGSIPVLHGIDLHIAQGEAVGILGHNGMGKTTLLRSIIGALLPTQGTILFNGTDVSRMVPHQRAQVGMAYVPQGREIFPNLSVTDNLRMGWVKRGRATADDLDALLANFPRLKPLLDRMGGSLSGGEQQLLALARALAGDPQLLLLDEPTEGIQPSIIEEIAETLTVLRQQRSLTIVLVEQNLDFIASVSERVLVIKRGQITGEIPREHLNDLDTVSEYTGVSSTH
jgi:branched-chain amino acid transport system ATP-binding protein